MQIDRLVNPLPPVVRDVWIKIRDAIAYYGTRPLVAGEGVPGPTNQHVPPTTTGTATGASTGPTHRE